MTAMSQIHIDLYPINNSLWCTARHFSAQMPGIRSYCYCRRLLPVLFSFNFQYVDMCLFGFLFFILILCQRGHLLSSFHSVFPMLAHTPFHLTSHFIHSRILSKSHIPQQYTITCTQCNVCYENERNMEKKWKNISLNSRCCCCFFSFILMVCLQHHFLAVEFILRRNFVFSFCRTFVYHIFRLGFE